MSRIISTHDLYTISLFIVMQVTLQISLSENADFWCGDRQEKTLFALNGQNISLRFFLNDQLNDAQSLGWTRGNLLWVKLDNHSLEFIGNASADERRYTMAKVADKNAFDLSIALTEPGDSGKHVVKIYHRMQSLCAIVVFNVTIEATDPICSTIFDQESGRLQMSCQWVQVNVGDRAQLVAGNQVVYEYNAPEFHVNGNFTLTNQLSVYVDPEFIFEENIMPTTCVVSHIRRRRNKTCTFPPVEQHAIQDDIPKSVTFECCVPNYSFPLSWWFNDSGNLQIVNYTESYIVTGDRHGNVVFFCSQEDDFSTIKVLSIGQINLPGYQYCISFSSGSDRTHPNNSTDELRCETLIVNVTMTESTSPSYDTVTQENESSSNCVVSGLMNATTNPKYKKKPFSMETMLITVLVLSTIAHGVSIVAFIFSYRNDGKYDVSKHD